MFWQASLSHRVRGVHGARFCLSSCPRKCHFVAIKGLRSPCLWSGVANLRQGRWLVPCGAATGRTGSELPQDWTQVLTWSRREFRRCVSPELPDSSVHLAKCCLLVALEEEAARSEEALHPELVELVKASSGSLRPRSAASASTWSGERLEALAAEVAALLDQQLEEAAPHRGVYQGDDAQEPRQAVEIAPEAGAGSKSPDAAFPATEPPSCSETMSVKGPDSVREQPRASEDHLVAPTGSFDFAAEQQQLLDRIHTSKPGAVGSTSCGVRSSRSMNGRGSDSSDNSSSNAETLGQHAGSNGGDSSGREDRYYGSAWPSGRRLYGRRQALYRRYPVQTLAAVNTVLFDRHGYLPCNRYGVPSDHQLSSVMERGVGASAALSILYLEVCERLGFPLAARPLEAGRYFVLWPVDAALTADGQRFLVDPYGRGGLLLLDEVCEIFGVEESALRPASRRELLAALLGELRDTHWAAAVGCSALPGSMTPLSVETALSNKVAVPTSGVHAASLRRALAAAEKRLWLLPNDSEALLHYGLLLYFSRRYDDAWIELALYLERFVSSGGVGDIGGGGEGSQASLGVVAAAAATLAAEVIDVGHSATKEASQPGKEEARSRGEEKAPAAAEANAQGISKPGASESEKITEAQMIGSVLSPETIKVCERNADLAAQVSILVERIRLELDFATAQQLI